MNNYAIFRCGKLKTQKALTDAYKHNVRIYQVENADPLREKENIELIDTMGKSYDDIIQETMATMKASGVPGKTIRKDAVLGFEVIISFSREQRGNFSIEEWAQKNLNWIDQTFNPKDHVAIFTDTETGQQKTITTNNVKHAIVHMDESNPHMHVFVVPIDDKGNLNASFYNRGRKHLQELQTQCAEVNAEFGLVRGEKHSTATPEQMSRYYNNILKAVEARLPEPMPEETIEEYKTRVDEVYQVALSNHRNEIVKKNQEIIHVRSAVDTEKNQLRQEVMEEKALFAKLTEKLDQYLPQEQKEDEIERERTAVNAAVENMEFKEAVRQYPDQEMAQQLMLLYSQVLQWQEEKEAKERAERESEER